MNDSDIKTVQTEIEKFDAAAPALDKAKGMGTAFTSAMDPKAGTITKAATRQNASDAIKSIDAALETIASNRATLGATLNRLDFNVNNLKSQSSSMVQLLLKSKTLTWRKKCLK